ncbi:hypothetical protein FK530_24505 [Tsukamurella conjunctivitidis]|uniref:IclR-ED domain-containing protein n=1 Tax=Tsukamurella conjunctivitidis TaxID=2592068 RepID=A0A5C5RJH4_9ACTN|nr:IclR family transcriptional regulator C-terminal domain-containing protein [Tsukamurella conjunctivitidis]TWS23156.1 hypothetical protein FK530_24505 [Tsukamurella conjunctivitidis]
MIRPALQAVSSEFNELVHLARLSGFSVVYVDKVEPDRPIRVVSRVGKEVPAVRTALGRSFIGSMPNREELLPWFFSDPAVRDLDPQTLEELHTSVRENFTLLDTRGWTQENGENEKGISCVAVPLSVDGQIQLAISVSTPTERMPAERREAIVMGIAEAIEALPDSARVSVASRPLALRALREQQTQVPPGGPVESVPGGLGSGVAPV